MRDKKMGVNIMAHNIDPINTTRHCKGHKRKLNLSKTLNAGITFLVSSVQGELYKTHSTSFFNQ